MFWFVILFTVFAILILVSTGLANFGFQMKEYTKDCVQQIRNISEYLTELMKTEGEDFAQHQEYFMNHYREMKIPYYFKDFEAARRNFITLFSKTYPGRTLGVDLKIGDTSPEVQNAYFIYKHEYWLKTFENAREKFDLPYTYYLVMGDSRARLETLPDGGRDPDHNVLYLIDGERTKDKEKGPSGEEYLYLGDTYLNKLSDYGVMWKTWQTGEPQDDYIEWDNSWGHTYGYYMPLTVKGKKLGLVVAETNVESINQEILMDTLGILLFEAIGLGIGFLIMLLLIRKKVVRRMSRLEDAMMMFEQTKDPIVVETLQMDYKGRDEVAKLGQQFISLVHELSEHLKKLTNTSRQLEKSRKREIEMAGASIRDVLTGVRNRASYDREIPKIQYEIESGETHIGLVVIEVSHLQEINREFGRENGNQAVVTVCRLFCKVFEHSAIFRTKSEQFVAIIKGNDYRRVLDLVRSFKEKAAFRPYNNMREMYEKPSARIGFALYDLNLDEGSYDSMYERAVREMK